MNKYIYRSKKLDYEKINISILLLLFLVVAAFTPVLNIAGKSMGESLACFAIGFFLLSSDKVMDTLERRALIPTIIFIALLLLGFFTQLYGINVRTFEILWIAGYRLYMWMGILTFLGLGKRFLNKTNRIYAYLSKAAFPLYLFHQSFLVIIAYFTLQYIEAMCLQFIIIMSGSFIMSVICYEICRRFKITSFMFSIKHAPFIFKVNKA